MTRVQIPIGALNFKFNSLFFQDYFHDALSGLKNSWNILHRNEKARHIYEAHREEWEKQYMGKIIAIDLEENDLAVVGERIEDVDIDARKKRPGHRLFM